MPPINYLATIQPLVHLSSSSLPVFLSLSLLPSTGCPALWTLPWRFVLPEHSVQPRGERQSGGLAYALNRVDILSLPWKVERTLETLGGSRKMRRRGRVKSRKGFEWYLFSLYSLGYCLHLQFTGKTQQSSGEGLAWQKESGQKVKSRRKDRQLSWFPKIPFCPISRHFTKLSNKSAVILFLILTLKSFFVIWMTEIHKKTKKDFYSIYCDLFKQRLFLWFFCLNPKALK